MTTYALPERFGLRMLLKSSIFMVSESELLLSSITPRLYIETNVVGQVTDWLKGIVGIYMKTCDVVPVVEPHTIQT